MDRYSATVDATGISGPDFPTCLANLTADYLAIFGADTYLGNDTQDGQFLAIIARGFADNVAAAIAVYNGFSPGTAQGNGLSSVVKINGLLREVPSPSTAFLTIVGQANITITNGQASDGVNLWVLPKTVTIPPSGTIAVQAACASAGAINAGIGTITTIATPVFGWQSVTNAAIANPGTPVETDSALRQRQSQSVALPSQTIFDGIVAALLAVPGVTRLSAYENNTGSVNGLGIAANTLAFIVEGGLNTNIWNAIYTKITPGIPTAGAQSKTIIDANGSTRAINYDIRTAAVITVNVTVKALAGWSVNTEPLIAQAIVDYINAIPGNSTAVGYLDLVVPGKLLGTQYAGTFRITAVQIAKNGGGFAAADAALAYNEMPTAVVGGVAFTVT